MTDPKTLPLAVMAVDDGHALVVPATGEEAVIAALFGAVAVDAVWRLDLSAN